MRRANLSIRRNIARWSVHFFTYVHLDLTLFYQFVCVLVFRQTRKNHIILLSSEFFDIWLIHLLWDYGTPRVPSLISLDILILTGLVIESTGNLPQAHAIFLVVLPSVGLQRNRIAHLFLRLKPSILLPVHAALRLCAQANTERLWYSCKENSIALW